MVKNDDGNSNQTCIFVTCPLILFVQSQKLSLKVMGG